MRKHGLALLGGVAVLAALPTGSAQAASEPGAVARLAGEAATAVAQEQALVAVIEPGSSIPRATLEQLAAIDVHGTELLARLDVAGAEIGTAARTALGRLGPLGERATKVPGDGVYVAAIADLMQLATVPAPRTVSGSTSTGFGYEGLVMVALMFVALGLTALLFTLRQARPRRTDRALAFSDALTGLGNRRRLDNDVDELVNASVATRHRVAPGGSTSVIMLDIDHFKAINDQYGHHYGDDVLRQVGSMLTREVRVDDMVYRYGGEEFCILLPDASCADAERVAQRLVGAARRLLLPGDVRVTLSAGVADGAAVEVDRTLRAADQALLAAKRAGRDRAMDTTAA